MSPASKRIGVGIVGAGFMGRTYAEVVQKHLSEEATLVAVSGGSRASQLAEDYGGAHEEDWRNLCRREDVSVVIIASPHEHHATQCMHAAQAGKHVMVEKPMATSVEDCDAMLKAAGDAGVQLGVAFTQRKRVCPAKAKELIDWGDLGRITHIQCWHVVPNGTASLPEWQSMSSNVGVLLGHGIHCFDAIRWLAGSEIVSVSAMVGNLVSAYGVETSSDVLLRLRCGARANILCSFEAPAPGFPGTQFGFHITCQHGLLILDAYGSLEVSRAGAPFETVAKQSPIDWQAKGFLDPVRLESYASHLSEFFSGVVDNVCRGPSGYDGRQAVAAVVASYESSATGRHETPM